jgi:hypothetical protein
VNIGMKERQTQARVAALFRNALGYDYFGDWSERGGNANTKRPDVVLHINGIAVGVLELKRSTISVAEGIRQNLDNHKKEFIQPFFSTRKRTGGRGSTPPLRRWVGAHQQRQKPPQGPRWIPKL